MAIIDPDIRKAKTLPSRFYTETKTVTSRWFESDIPDDAAPNATINL